MSRRKEAAEASDASRFADLLLQVVDEIGLGGFERGAKAEKHRRDDAEKECYRENRKVWPQFDDHRKIHRGEQALKLLQQQIVAPGAEHKADHAAAKSKEESFTKQLPDNPPP